MSISWVSSAQELRPSFVSEADDIIFTVQDTFYSNDVITDTMDGEIWNRIYRSTFAEGSSSNGRDPIVIGHYRTEDRKVYYDDGFFNGLLYDFNLEAGEEARVLPWGEGFSSTSTVVYLVDSVKYMNCIFDDSVKVMYVTPYRNYEEGRLYRFGHIWVEGIGDTQHPFPPKTCFAGSSCESRNNWNKYFFEGVWYELWNSEGTAQLPCQEITTSTRNPILNRPIKLSPNPVSPGGELTIAAGDFSVEQASLVGLADGRLVAEWRLGRADVTTLTVPATVPPGVYVLVLTDREGRLVREKVVVR